MSDMGGMGPGALFQQERLWEQRIANKILSNMLAMRSLRKDRDAQLDGLYNRIPPPPELSQGKTWLRYRMAICKSKELKRVIAYILKFIIKPLLDLFQKDPVIIPSYWKDGTTGGKERGVIMAPGRAVPRPTEYEEIAIDELGGLPEMEDQPVFTDSESGVIDRIKRSFLGPSSTEEDDVPAGSEEEGMDL